ncbi:NAD(+) synthase [Candidatus Desantisbacteria bacterium CG07_land_8_20_14_0_80_39_15]|uniref:NH(3)-dependent NAD(+) synthetase n=2 Tax=unclassified Candidatus Desantisiibacteriota TaxID=3106372 RepID=A0A2H9PAB9_9BACT|nr:MAG: NAD(+) synthase [Candidatus Desantisbacteria bacterium CG07_land_8_20_14_0_80_39_15]PIZ15314.1 MAG: NAD(+) synthase [Candidatus Desantisbacteria bacterium CG_4_10_14_0_8_um_filter_39_17]
MDLKPEVLQIDLKKVAFDLEKEIRNRMKELHREGIILGISGGIDSAVALALAAGAAGRDNVLGLILPERDSHPESRTDAIEHAKSLGIKIREVNIEPMLRRLGIYKLFPEPLFMPRRIIEKFVKKQFEKSIKTSKEPLFLSGMLGNPSVLAKKTSAYYRSKHRMRMITLYFYGELHNYLMLGTCNKTEISIGFFVKYGDSASDFDPLKNLYKMQVRQLAHHLGVTQKIIIKAPTPDLLPGITDELAMGITYEILDLILFGLENKMESSKIAKELGINEETVNYVQELNRCSQHMRDTGH